jgi:methionyl aminopeptidase
MARLLLVVAAFVVLGFVATRVRAQKRSPLSIAYPPEVLSDARALAVELGHVFDAIEPELRAGVTTRHVDERVRQILEQRGLRPAFLGYHGYPAATVTSLNDEIANGLPSERVLRGGDLLKLEIGLRGAHSFAVQAWTYPIGPLSDEDQRLITTASAALRQAVAAVKHANARSGDVGWAIQRVVEEAGFNVSRAFVGFGIGRDLHEDPPLPGWGSPGRGWRFKRDRAYCIYVIAQAGTHEAGTDANHWTTRTKDGKRAVTFSQMIAVGDGGVEVLSPARPGSGGGVPRAP